MKTFVATLVALFATALLAEASTVPVLSEYDQLYQLCENGGPDSYVGVRYEGDIDKTYNYGECYPYELSNDVLAEMAVFCKSVTCNSNPNPDCSGGAVPPVPVPIVAGLTLVNLADWVQLLGQGATCQPNALPG